MVVGPPKEEEYKVRIMIEKNWESLIKSNKLEVRFLTQDLRSAEVVIEPLEPGFGLTLGNALRRVLLSSLQGAAITSLKIDGVLHEFSTIPGVKEDVTDIILNIKSLSFRTTSELHKKLKISAKGPCTVTGSHIQPTAGVEVLDPDSVICTLDEGAVLNMELTVQNGKGYVVASHHYIEDKPIGLIPIDSIFSPVKRVIYRVEQTRVGQRTDYDKLIVTVTTDGSIKPDDAVAFSARILQDQFQQFINFEEPKPLDKKEKKEELSFNKYLLKKVDELELSVRSANCLKNENIFYIGDLVQKSKGEMLRTPNFGRKSLNEIKEVLSHMGLGFGMSIPSWPPENVDELAKSVEDPFN